MDQILHLFGVHGALFHQRLELLQIANAAIQKADLQSGEDVVQRRAARMARTSCARVIGSNGLMMTFSAPKAR